MYTWRIVRWGFSSELTLGESQIDSKQIYWAENPWLENQANVSCIPLGDYIVRPVGPTPNFPYPHLHVLEVPWRQYIAVHRGNSDEDTRGCLLPGLEYGQVKGHGVLNSTGALTWLMAHSEIGKRDTRLEIRARFPYAVS